MGVPNADIMLSSIAHVTHSSPAKGRNDMIESRSTHRVHARLSSSERDTVSAIKRVEWDETDFG
jgi:hypothetical protein